MSAHSGPADWWTLGTVDGRKHIATKGIVQNGLILNLDAGVADSYPGSGTNWFNLVTNTNTGSLTNGPTYTDTNYGAIVFDGLDDYIDLPYNILSGTEEFTVGVWIRSNQSTATTTSTIFGNFPAGNLQLVYSTSTIGLRLGNDLTTVSSPNTIFNTNTNYLTAIRSGSSSTLLYINTVLGKSGSSTSTIGSVSNFRIGSNTTGTQTFSGLIYNVQIYNRALTSSEIQRNFNAYLERYPTTLVQGITITDRSFTISPAVNGKTVWDLDVDGTLDISTTSTTFTITPTSNDVSTQLKLWGGGGGYGGGAGGGGGYSAGNFTFKFGTNYQIIVGQGGRGTTAARTAGAGAGGTGLQFSTDTVAIIVAGGGGGDAGGGLRGSGAGGGTNGQNAASPGGFGGTQSAAGAGGVGSRRTGASGSGRNGGGGATGSLGVSGGTGFGNGGIGAFNGSDSGSGGGGGGYFGGGEGGGDAGGYGGGGGSGYTHPTLVTNSTSTTGNVGTAANNADPARGNAGTGGTLNVTGGNGLHSGYNGKFVIAIPT